MCRHKALHRSWTFAAVLVWSKQNSVPTVGCKKSLLVENSILLQWAFLICSLFTSLDQSLLCWISSKPVRSNDPNPIWSIYATDDCHAYAKESLLHMLVFYSNQKSNLKTIPNHSLPFPSDLSPVFGGFATGCSGDCPAGSSGVLVGSTTKRFWAVSSGGIF